MNSGRVLVGGVLVVLGALLALDALEVLEAGPIIGAWWPVVFLVAAALMYASNPRRWLAPLVVAAVAATGLAVTTGVVGADVWELVVPVVLIVLGIAAIARRPGRTVLEPSEDAVRSFVVFAGSELSSRSGRFEGGSVSSVFGGTELDLRDAVPAPGAALDVFTLFGGTEIRVPEGWNVVVHGFPVFGGIENVTTRDRLPAGAPRLDVNATVAFGGLEIRH